MAVCSTVLLPLYFIIRTGYYQFLRPFHNAMSGFTRLIVEKARCKLGPCLIIKLFLISPFCFGDWTGEAGIELRYFTSNAAFSEQFDGFNASAYFLPEYYVDWNERKDALVFEPFLRVDQHDPERNHADLREFHWRHTGNEWELKLGVSTLFWGVTESLHLVDVINQTDGVENLDGEDKLGQPMAMLRWIKQWGTLDVLVMPGFRERKYPSAKGRFSGFLVDTAQPLYESSARDLHTDLALRWSKVLGNFDIGLSYFRGTSREPRFLISAESLSDRGPMLRPFYDQIDQLGIDVQATLGAWLWKLEAIHRSGQGQSYSASTAGFEYSLYSVFGTDADIGLLLEYSYDQRAQDNQSLSLRLNQPLSQVGPDNDVFVGGRFGFNDMQGSELLAGCALDMDSSARFCIIEGNRRLNDQWVVGLEARVFSAIDSDHLFAPVRDDDLIQLDFTYHF
ncbi:MAG: hypothetical protein AB8B86_06000 [Pseudomonadales bacterium]